MDANEEIIEFVIINDINQMNELSKHATIEMATKQKGQLTENEHETCGVFESKKTNGENLKEKDDNKIDEQHCDQSNEKLATIEDENSERQMNIYDVNKPAESRNKKKKLIEPKEPRKRAKLCMVPLCRSSDKEGTKKILYPVPRDKRIRKKFAKLSRRSDPISCQSQMYICEDHFDLENDTEMHWSGRKLKKFALPKKFHCQPGRFKEVKKRAWGSRLEEIDRKKDELMKKQVQLEDNTKSTPQEDQSMEQVSSNIVSLAPNQLVPAALAPTLIAPNQVFQPTYLLLAPTQIVPVLRQPIPNRFLVLKTKSIPKCSPVSVTTKYTMAKSFPRNFKFGVATSSYQIEGAWNKDGKCESIWDYQCHTFPERIADRSNGDIACDSYNKLDEDIANLKHLSVHFYRFSISWCRILPTGFSNQINQPGIDYYNKLIDKLLENGIEPIATMYHWELPQALENLGGWCNPIMADYFVSYARVCFRVFGDRVKTWITINEPCQIAEYAYGDTILAPFYNSKGIGNYLAAHTLLLAHGLAYRMYEKEFKELQAGRVGISIEGPWHEPESQEREDVEAAERSLQMYLGWFAHPIFSKDGDYPLIMRERIDQLSQEHSYDYSRLPKFTAEEIDILKGSSDFFGLNHYITFMVKNQTCGDVPSHLNDRGVSQYQRKEWDSTAMSIFKVVPWGLRKLLNWIKKEYNNPEVMITENGYGAPEHDNVADSERIHYIKVYLTEILAAVLEDKCNVTSYTYWSLMDNFEWSMGYKVRFGLFHVDFKDPNRKRVAKSSASYYKNVIQTGLL